ncbi:MAG: tRNA pseudouridine(38-40) synthase TruA [Christensenellaceae bacterium]|jgi:tRNA pseudouridine38-40 synthase|nr:tRNA pseudouridine(38-40) synthase TruA [Christensenellaceae bacterium]
MKRIRLILQYDGTAYVGWQVQANGLAIQQVLEAELYKLTGESTRLHASGRTDSGVHARAQVAHFDTGCRIPPEKFCYALNAGLPGDIRVLHSEEAPEGFHARFDVVKKHYRYTVRQAPHADVFHRNTALHVHYPLEIARMRQAAAPLLGEHDFAAFKAAGVEMQNTVRTLYQSEWTQAGNLLCYDVTGSGFLYNMVRILVGTMLEIGGGKREPGCMAQALQSGSRNDAGATAPAHGLMLYRVEYPGFDTAEYI